MTFVVTSIQYLWVLLQFVIIRNDISTLGGPIFITYTILDFGVICIILLLTLKDGASANAIDYDFKHWLIKLSSRITQIKIQAQKGQIFTKDG